MDSRGAAEWVRNKFWPLWWRVLVVDKSTDHAKPHSICFLPQYQKKSLSRFVDNSDLKVHALHYANELLVRVRLSFQILLHAQHAETVRKNVWEKSNDAYSLSIRVQTTLNHIWFVFYPNFNVKESVFFSEAARSSASWKWHYVTHWRVQPCLYYYRQRQINQSDCEISGNCGKKQNGKRHSVYYWVMDALGRFAKHSRS